MRTVARLHLVPARSRIIVAFVLLATTATAVLVGVLALPWWLRGLLVVTCAAQCAFTLRALHRDAPRLLVVGADRQLAITGRTGLICEERVLDATYVSASLVALAWRVNGERRSRAWLVASDVLSAEERRRLRVWLRYGREPQADDADGSGPAPHAAPIKGKAAGPPVSHAAPSMHMPLSPFG